MRHNSMRMTYVSTELEQIEFARKAAEDFALHPKHWSFTDGPIEPGALLALRWGLGDDCVLVLKLDDSFTPANYQQLVREFPTTPPESPPALDDCPF